MIHVSFTNGSTRLEINGQSQKLRTLVSQLSVLLALADLTGQSYSSDQLAQALWCDVSVNGHDRLYTLISQARGQGVQVVQSHRRYSTADVSSDMPIFGRFQEALAAGDDHMKWVRCYEQWMEARRSILQDQEGSWAELGRTSFDHMCAEILRHIALTSDASLHVKQRLLSNSLRYEDQPVTRAALAEIFAKK